MAVLRRDAGRLVHREPIRPGAQRRQGDAAAAVLDGQFEAAAIGARQQFGLAALAAAPHRPHGVDHVLGVEPAGGRDHGRAGRAAVRAAGVGVAHDFRAPAAVDRPVHAAPARQAAVRRVDDCIDLLERDVALLQLDRLSVDFSTHIIHGTIHRRFGESPWRSKSMRTCLGFCLALVLWSTPAPGREIFVDNVGGDDRFTGQQAAARPTCLVPCGPSPRPCGWQAPATLSCWRRPMPPIARASAW